MKRESRVVKSQYNLMASFVNNIVVTVLGFATRTVFVHSLGVDYLGLNGLFTNVLTILSLAELGVGSAITFSLYKPIADNDIKKIQALMELYKNAYRIIGFIILVIGILITPILKYIVNLNAGVDINYYAIYYMFLGNTVVSYLFFAYRSVIIYAHQNNYILTKIETIVALAKSIIQFLVLIILKNYYIYLVVPIVVGILKNLYVSRIAGKTYPYIDIKAQEPLHKNEKKEIFKNVYALALFKISSVVYGATDNLIISTFLGTKIVGLLSNYTMIIQLVTTYVNMFFQSLYASVGNLYATETKEYTYIVYKRLDLLNFWIYTYCTICLGCFLNPFISLWLGNEYCLEDTTIILLAIVFYIPGLNNVINIYKDACGLFKEVQFRAVATAIVNLGASILLVFIIGINGVFVGTIVAYLSTIYVVDPRVIYKKIFRLPSRLYYIELAKKIIIFIILCVPCYYSMHYFEINTWYKLILSFLIISIFINIIYIWRYHRTEEYRSLKEILLKTINGIIHR